MRYDRNHCPLCEISFQSGGRATASREIVDALEIMCPRCGSFIMTGHAWDAYLKHGQMPINARRYLLSGLAKNGHLRGGGPLRVDENLCKRINEGGERDRAVPEKIELVVRWFAEQSKHPGDRVRTTDELDYPAAFCRSQQEWAFLREEVTKRGLVELVADGVVRVTSAGWEWLEDRPKTAGDRAFVAMAFDPALAATWIAIEGAVTGAGYAAERVDRHEYVGGVMDQVVALVRRSRFVVADFTLNRGGVYYEAGFAAGRDIPVIPTCREDHLDVRNEQTGLHFDVRHINFLPWRPDELPAFQQRLQARIEALFGRGSR